MVGLPTIQGNQTETSGVTTVAQHTRVEMGEHCREFHSGLPRTLNGYMVIWEIVDRLTKPAHFLPSKVELYQVFL